MVEATQLVVLCYSDPRSKTLPPAVVADFSLVPVYHPGHQVASYSFPKGRGGGLLLSLSQNNGFLSGPHGQEVCCLPSALKALLSKERDVGKK